MYGFIYKITCLVTNKIYVGKTTKTINERFKAHIKEKMSNSHKGLKIPSRTIEQRQNYAKASSNRIHIHKGNQNKNPKKKILKNIFKMGES